MTEPSLNELQGLLQTYLNCVELCRVFGKQTRDPYVKEALDGLIDDLQDSLASLSGHLRRLGGAPGAYEVDRQGKARIRDVLNTRSLYDQMLAVRDSLVELVAWYTSRDAQTSPDWLLSLSEEAQRMAGEWNRQMDEITAGLGKPLRSQGT